MEVKAKLKFVRLSPRKSRLVADLIRGLAVDKAETELRFLTKKPAAAILKLLHSAIANAKNDFDAKTENLYVKKITVDGGPVYKRYEPRAFGRASEIRKPTSHITIVLGDKDEQGRWLPDGKSERASATSKKTNRTEKSSKYDNDNKTEKKSAGKSKVVDKAAENKVLAEKKQKPTDKKAKAAAEEKTQKKREKVDVK